MFITAKIASVFISFIIVFAVGTNLKPRVILAPCQRYGRQRMTSGRDRRMDQFNFFDLLIGKQSTPLRCDLRKGSIWPEIEH